MPKDMEELYNSLANKGHKCLMYCGIGSPRLTWCQQEVCNEETKWQEMHERHKQQLKLQDRLAKEGHTCMSTPECYPARISWCKETICPMAHVIVMKPTIHLVPIDKINMLDEMRRTNIISEIAWSQMSDV